MHASSLENMQKCFERFVEPSVLLNQESVRVLDVGGANVNGSYADIFSDPKFEYIAADLGPGEGVDVVLEDPYLLPFDDASVDIVVSGQVLEHAEFFWKLFEELTRVVSRKGFVFLIVPSAGPVHRYPVDCYRFYPDAMTALSRYTNIPLLDCWQDDRGPWNDLVGVFSLQRQPRAGAGVRLPPNRFSAIGRVAPLISEDQGVDIEKTSGQTPYTDVLAQIHRTLQPGGYLEIGVRTGSSLALASCPSIAIDPEPDLEQPLADHQQLYRQTSDAFFEHLADTALEHWQPDLVFIDGMHLFEFALRDFMNVERRASATTLVLIDDIYPNHPLQAARERQSRVWTGDVWKLHDCLRIKRPDLTLIPLDTFPSGLLLVAGLDPENHTLWEQYNPTVRAYQGRTLDSLNSAVLNREGARSPDDPVIQALIERLRAERERPAGTHFPKALREAFGP